MYSSILMEFTPGKDGLLFGQDVICDPAKARYGIDMQGLRRKEEPQEANVCQYKTYNKLSLIGDQQLLAAHKYSYDLTFIMPNPPECEEFRRTSGHYHAPNADGVIYPEIYEVIHGTALFVLQKKKNPWDSTSSELEDIRLVEVRAGEKILLPPGYGHCSYNIGEDVLLFSNIAACGTPIDYAGIRGNRGMSYYAVRGEKGCVFERNERYSQLPEAKRYRVLPCPELGLMEDENLYETATKHPELLAYITNPELLGDRFEKTFLCEGAI